jgi:hypothetical protein
MAIHFIPMQYRSSVEWMGNVYEHMLTYVYLCTCVHTYLQVLFGIIMLINGNDNRWGHLCVDPLKPLCECALIWWIGYNVYSSCTINCQNVWCRFHTVLCGCEPYSELSMLMWWERAGLIYDVAYWWHCHLIAIADMHLIAMTQNPSQDTVRPYLSTPQISSSLTFCRTF